MVSIITSENKTIASVNLDSDHVFMIEQFKKDEKNIFQEPHRHRFFEMIWIEEGQGFHLIDCEKYPLIPGRIYLITPGQIHKWQQKSQTKGYLIAFSEAFLDKTYRDIILQGAKLFMVEETPPYLEISQTDAPCLKSIAHLMLHEYKDSSPDWNMIRPLLTSFLYYLTRLGRKVNKTITHPQYARLAKLQTLIDQHYKKQSSVEFYASKLYITSKRLNEITKDIRGRTVSQMIHRRLILEAKRDLSLSQDSIKIIAYRLGFEDPSYFTRFFKRLTGQTPHHFRRKMQNMEV